MATLITGAAGFIGTNLVRYWRTHRPDDSIISFDALTYCGHRENLAPFEDDAKHHFVKGDICEGELVGETLRKFNVDAIVHLAAESHVDRSIENPLRFVETNVLGTATLLREAQKVWGDRQDVRFHHISTDEVFGHLADEGKFHEDSPYAPRSPYSASKAASDHLVRAWHATYHFPIVVTNCTNNYGPYQYPEKLVPLAIRRVLAGKTVPVYGKGQNVRDWLYVEDHCSGILRVFENGQVGRTYGIGGECELKNIDLVRMLLAEIDSQLGKPEGHSLDAIEYVSDRPGHDLRYAMDIGRIKTELQWSPRVSFTEGLRMTVSWYLENQDWTEQVLADKRDADKLHADRLDAGKLHADKRDADKGDP